MIEQRHHIMTDERLEWLADRFICGHFQKLLKISFEQYLKDPDGYDFVARVLDEGGALRRVASPSVALGRDGWELVYRGLTTGRVMRTRMSTHN